jgi:hypothetical protein
VEEGSGVAEGGAIVVDDHNVQELRLAGHGARLRPGRERKGRSGEQRKGWVFVLCSSVVSLLQARFAWSVVRDTIPHTVYKLA